MPLLAALAAHPSGRSLSYMTSTGSWRDTAGGISSCGERVYAMQQPCKPMQSHAVPYKTSAMQAHVVPCKAAAMQAHAALMQR